MNALSSIHYINSRETNAALMLGEQLQLLLSDYPLCCFPPVILCIGTDRVTGDSLGPLVGTLLQTMAGTDLAIYGTLQMPIHALNLKKAWKQIKKKHPRSIILAIDASLGSNRHLGYITFGPGSLHPGAGVQKDLIPVGDVFITGIISELNRSAQIQLQNVRLAAVFSLANCIACGILHACRPCEQTAVAATVPHGLPVLSAE